MQATILKKSKEFLFGIGEPKTFHSSVDRTLERSKSAFRQKRSM